MGEPFVFMNYRRSDASLVAQALYLQLRERFGSRRLFMDVNTIEWGDRWPERISSELRRANVVIAIIGPNWLTTADQYGRRLLDDPADWVRTEIATALRQRAHVMPILVNDCRMPPAEVLPEELRALLHCQAVSLRTGTDAWSRDLRFIGDHLHSLGVPEREGAPQPLPSAPHKRDLPGFTEQQLAAALKDPELRQWEPWEEVLANEYPARRQELRRVFEFGSFAEAIRFMAFLAPRFDQVNHHPRWANEWVRVAIRFTAWAAGNRITEVDINVARQVKSWFREFRGGRTESCEPTTGSL